MERGRRARRSSSRVEVENRQRVHCVVTPMLAPLVAASGVTWFPAAAPEPASTLLAPDESRELTIDAAAAGRAPHRRLPRRAHPAGLPRRRHPRRRSRPRRRAPPRAKRPSRAEGHERPASQGAARRDPAADRVRLVDAPQEAGRSTATLLASLAARLATLHLISGADAVGSLAAGLSRLGREVAATAAGAQLRQALETGRAGPNGEAIWRRAADRRLGVAPCRRRRSSTSSATTSRCSSPTTSQPTLELLPIPPEPPGAAGARGAGVRRRSSTSRSGSGPSRSRSSGRSSRWPAPTIGLRTPGRRPARGPRPSAAASSCGDHRRRAPAARGVRPLGPRLQGLAAPRRPRPSRRASSASSTSPSTELPRTPARGRSGRPSSTCPTTGWVGNVEVRGARRGGVQPAPSIGLEQVALAVDGSRGTVHASVRQPGDGLELDLVADALVRPDAAGAAAAPGVGLGRVVRRAAAPLAGDGRRSRAGRSTSGRRAPTTTTTGAAGTGVRTSAGSGGASWRRPPARSSS